MKKFFFPIASILLIVSSAFTIMQTSSWKISDNYAVKFNGGDPSGEFKGLKGLILFDPADLANSKFEVSIDVATINTGNGMKNTHAKSAMWLDAEKYPVIKFTSTSITKSGDTYSSKGTLDFHGVQKEIIIPFTFVNNTFAGTIEVNRLDYNVNVAEPEHGAAKFKLEISVPVTK